MSNTRAAPAPKLAAMAFSPADLDLARRVVASGRAPSPGPENALAERIRKWNSWGILDAPGPGRSLGRGRGSEVRGYPEGSEEVVIAMLEAFSSVGLRHRHPAVLVAWWRGAPVGHAALVEAFKKGLEAELEMGLRRSRVRTTGGVRGVAPDVSGADRKVFMEGLFSMMTNEPVTPTFLMLLARFLEPRLAAVDLPQLVDVVRGLAALRDVKVDPSSIPGSREDLAKGLVKPDLQGKPVPDQSLREVATAYNALAGLAAVDAATREELDAHRDFLRALIELMDLSTEERDEVTMALVVPTMVGALDTLDGLAGRRTSRLPRSSNRIPMT